MDYFLIPRILVSSIIDCKIDLIHISDHAPVTLDINIQNSVCKFRWQCNRGVLSDLKFCQYIREELSKFLEINHNGTVNPTVLWETTKAYLIGLIVSHCSARKKKTIMEQTSLENGQKVCEQQHKQYPTQENYKKVTDAKAALSSLLSQREEKGLFSQKQKLYKYSNKPGPLLSKLLNNHKGHNTIACLKGPNGQRRPIAFFMIIINHCTSQNHRWMMFKMNLF